MKIEEFENHWVHEIKSKLLKSFPDDFIVSEKHATLKLPGKPLMKGSELFGNFEIIDIDGDALLSTDNIDKIKYILYSNINNPLEIKILESDEQMKIKVKEYETHLDDLVKTIKDDFLHKFPDSDKFTSVINKIFQRLNLQRH